MEAGQLFMDNILNAKLDSREPYIDGNPIYAKDEKKGKYVVIDQRKKSDPNYSKKDKMLFPRIWSDTQARHAGGYVNWAGLKNKDVSPTFGENLTYFFRYQIGWSYLRYFMWNFAGRQNDYMNLDGNSLYGNWESGIKIIDNARLGYLHLMLFQKFSEQQSEESLFLSLNTWLNWHVFSF